MLNDRSLKGDQRKEREQRPFLCLIYFSLNYSIIFQRCHLATHSSKMNQLFNIAILFQEGIDDTFSRLIFFGRSFPVRNMPTETMEPRIRLFVIDVLICASVEACSIVERDISAYDYLECHFSHTFSMLRGQLYQGQI